MNLVEGLKNAAFISIKLHAYDGEETWKWYRVDYYMPGDDGAPPHLGFSDEDHPYDEQSMDQKEIEEGIADGWVRLHKIVPIDITL